MSTERRRESGGLTCQTNGKLLRFRRPKTRARNFQTPALPVKPSLLRRVDEFGGAIAGLVRWSDAGRTVVRSRNQDSNRNFDMVPDRRGSI